MNEHKQSLSWRSSAPIPRHVAIIMDGNGRWAEQRGLPRSAGHGKGVEAVRRTVRAAIELGLQYLTIFSFSSENWSRPASEVDELMGLVGLEGFAKAYPHQLSGGMAQRASLARALVNDPSLLILDEPLGKLDSLTRLTMQGELTRLWQRRGFTVLMVTHDVEEALLLANRVIVFSDRPARIRADLSVDLPFPRHRDHPRQRGLDRRVEVARPPQDLQVGVLHHIGGEFRPTQDAEDHAVKLGAGRTIQPLEGRAIALGNGGQQPRDFNWRRRHYPTDKRKCPRTIPRAYYRRGIRPPSRRN